MEEWELDFEWLRIRTLLKESFKKQELPDFNTVLFLIGLQELGRWKKSFSKEEKQDLMHVAVCRLLSYDGHYEFVGRDADGWPHWKLLSSPSTKGIVEQEKYLKEKIIQYFSEFKIEQVTSN
ncbi:MAG: hypothetical protein KA010_00320 [Saprospiraceae bacterium]|nr:hypothetical protein [Saprospiraceae bacterium]